MVRAHGLEQGTINEWTNSNHVHMCYKGGTDGEIDKYTLAKWCVVMTMNPIPFVY